MWVNLAILAKIRQIHPLGPQDHPLLDYAFQVALVRRRSIVLNSPQGVLTSRGSAYGPFSSTFRGTFGW
jgi:hypothetical protein